jgi:hypothetical protein
MFENKNENPPARNIDAPIRLNCFVKLQDANTGGQILANKIQRIPGFRI